MNSSTPTSSARFCYRLRVRYGECDAQKVVFNVHYGAYIDLAVIEFMRAIGWGATLIDGPLDYQLVKQTIEWNGSARFDQTLEISVWSTHRGNTSFTLAAEFRVAGHESPIAVAETVYVLVDARTLAKAPLGPDLRAALERGARGLLVDHADSSARRIKP